MSVITEEKILEQIKQILAENHLAVFMKGVPEAPRCGFSARVVERLNETGEEYVAVDVLIDPQANATGGVRFALLTN